MIPIELDQEIREGVFKTLPQIMDIQNEELRNKTADAWTYALQINGFKHIEEMPGSGMPEASAAGRPEYAHPRGWIQYAKSV